MILFRNVGEAQNSPSFSSRGIQQPPAAKRPASLDIRGPSPPQPQSEQQNQEQTQEQSQEQDKEQNQEQDQEQNQEQNQEQDKEQNKKQDKEQDEEQDEGQDEEQNDPQMQHIHNPFLMGQLNSPHLDSSNWRSYRSMLPTPHSPLPYSPSSCSSSPQLTPDSPPGVVNPPLLALQYLAHATSQSSASHSPVLLGSRMLSPNSPTLLSPYSPTALSICSSATLSPYSPSMLNLYSPTATSQNSPTAMGSYSPQIANLMSSSPINPVLENSLEPPATCSPSLLALYKLVQMRYHGSQPHGPDGLYGSVLQESHKHGPKEQSTKNLYKQFNLDA